jgi:hypothetical protein
VKNLFVLFRKRTRKKIEERERTREEQTITERRESKKEYHICTYIYVDIYEEKENTLWVYRNVSLVKSQIIW